jgi:hypothetical protein
VEGLTVAEEATLVAGDAFSFDQAGYSVSISYAGDRAAVGVIYDGHAGGYDAGSVRIFDRTGTTWSEVATLVAPDAEDIDQFGHSVSMSSDGTRVLVGCSGDYVAGVRTGSARVFVRDTMGAWSQEQALLPTGANADDRIGAAVSLSGDGVRAFVGAYWSDPPSGTNAGSVRVYVRSGSTWTLEQLLYDATSGSHDDQWFGYSISSNGDGSRVLVGIPFANRAEEWNRSVSTWSAGASLAPSGIVSTDEYRRAVALSADGVHALVGAWHRGPNERGAAWAFTRGASTWSVDQELVPSTADQFNNFGASVGLDGTGTRGVVGAPGDTVAGIFSAGSASVFTRVGTSWTEQPTLFASGTPEGGDQLGWAARMAGDGRRAILGMPGDSTYAGSGRVFTITGSNGDACTGTGDCDSGFCVDGVCCNSACGGGATDCQACSVAAGGTSTGTCTALSSPSSVVCRAAASGGCDVAETCIASSTSCPADGFASSATVCRVAASGGCDVAEQCTGSSAACPADGFASSATVCRVAASGGCDVAEQCTGSSAACPSDGFASSGTVCHTSTDRKSTRLNSSHNSESRMPSSA